jgi:hypothetical protein
MLVLRGGKGTPDRAAAAIDAYRIVTAPTTVLQQPGLVETKVARPRIDALLGRAFSLIHIAAASTIAKTVTTRAVTVALAFAPVRVRSTQPRVGSALSSLALLTTHRLLLEHCRTPHRGWAC